MKYLLWVFNFIRNNYPTISKLFIFILGALLILTLFPREGSFKYDYFKSKPWTYEDLYANFDFSIQKTDDAIKNEKKSALNEYKPYFTLDTQIVVTQKNDLIKEYNRNWNTFYSANNENKGKYLKQILIIFDSIYANGIIQPNADIENQLNEKSVIIVNNGFAEEKELKDFFTIHSADEYIKNQIINKGLSKLTFASKILENVLEQNVLYDIEINKINKDNLINSISTEYGLVQIGEKIISKGELVTDSKFQLLESFKSEYMKQFGSSKKYSIILLGQLLLVLISMLVLMMFLRAFRRDIYADNKNIILIIFLILMMVFITSITIRYNDNFLYLVPLCIVPITIRTFYDTRLALFVHIITIIIIGFLVNNSFQFVYIQLITGIITIISIVNLHHRSQLFTTSLFIFLCYSLVYTGLNFMQEGSFDELKIVNYLYFVGSAALTLFVYLLIYLFERIFGFITDFTLLELSDTNNELLRELAQKAPGTFQHSIQVSNLAEEAIHKIGGNALLMRTGALYHDLGKMEMPLYFIENQRGGINPHDEMEPEESAQIIISHVIRGVKKAKKFNIPEKIIDFIRTHHGTTYTHFFYKKYITQNSQVSDESKSIFSYRGPNPYSKETAVLMMADSVEAASRSLKVYNEESINNIVESIINKQIELEQFANADITLKDITIIKKIFKKKLQSMYHVRIEYPN